MPELKPFVISIWCGVGKPGLNEFLDPFVTEFNEILRSGVIINGHHIKIKFRCFIADAPARSHIKCKCI